MLVPLVGVRDTARYRRRRSSGGSNSSGNGRRVSDGGRALPSYDKPVRRNKNGMCTSSRWSCGCAGCCVLSSMRMALSGWLVCLHRCTATDSYLEGMQAQIDTAAAVQIQALHRGKSERDALRAKGRLPSQQPKALVETAAVETTAAAAVVPPPVPAEATQQAAMRRESHDARPRNSGDGGTSGGGQYSDAAAAVGSSITLTPEPQAVVAPVRVQAVARASPRGSIDGSRTSTSSGAKCPSCLEPSSLPACLMRRALLCLNRHRCTRCNLGIGRPEFAGNGVGVGSLEEALEEALQTQAEQRETIDKLTALLGNQRSKAAAERQQHQEEMAAVRALTIIHLYIASSGSATHRWHTKRSANLAAGVSLTAVLAGMVGSSGCCVDEGRVAESKAHGAAHGGQGETRSSRGQQWAWAWGSRDEPSRWR